jgi:Protein of unknown function (DUF3352)
VRPVRRPLAVLSVFACLAVVALAACGGDDEETSPLGNALSYLPKEAPFTVAIDTNLDGDQYKAVDSILGRFPIDAPSVKELLRDRLTGDGSPVDFEQDVEPILGNPFVVGATDVASFLESANPQDFVGAIEAKDKEALDQLIEKSEPREAGELAGAMKYEDGGTVFAVKDDVVVFAAREELLDQALERAEGDNHLDEGTFNAGLEGLPGNAALRVYADLQALIGSDTGSEEARKVEWVGALRTLGMTASARDDEVELQVKLRTDPEGLSDEDLPIAAGDESPPVLSRDGEVGIGIRNPAQIVHFAEAAGQALDPGGFGDYAQAKQTLDARLDISLDDDLIGQLTGDLAASIAPDGGFGVRAEVERPEALARTLDKIADVLPSFAEGAGFGSVTIEKPDGGEGVYTLAQADGDDIAFGVVDGVLVVADDPEEAEEIAAEEPEAVDGAQGAVVMRSDAGELANAVIEDFGPALGLSGFNAIGAQLFTDEFRDLSGSISSSTGGMTGRVTLTFD